MEDPPGPGPFGPPGAPVPAGVRADGGGPHRFPGDPSRAFALLLRRPELQRFDVPGSPYETVIGLVEVPPGLGIGRHAHPGIEAGYMRDGEATVSLDGQPDRVLKAGDAYRIPYGAVHDVR